MKAIVVSLLLTLLLLGAVNAAPWLSADKQEGVQYYKVVSSYSGLSVVEAPDTALKYNLDSMPNGMSNLTIFACKKKNDGGESCSKSVTATVVMIVSSYYSPSYKTNVIRKEWYLKSVK
jgi:hypothetical protein